MSHLMDPECTAGGGLHYMNSLAALPGSHDHLLLAPSSDQRHEGANLAQHAVEEIGARSKRKTSPQGDKR